MPEPTEAEIVRASILAWDPDTDFTVDALYDMFYADGEPHDKSEVITQLAALVDEGYVVHVPGIRGMYRLAVVEAVATCRFCDAKLARHSIDGEDQMMCVNKTCPGPASMGYVKIFEIS